MFFISDTLGRGPGLCLHCVNHSQLLCVGVCLCSVWLPQVRVSSVLGIKCKLTCFFGAGDLSSHNPRQSCDRSKSPNVQERSCGLDRDEMEEEDKGQTFKKRRFSKKKREGVEDEGLRDILAGRR